jgi:HD-GYP domain-containing protein (c-di-GMP phosphodiesterase class II)
VAELSRRLAEELGMSSKQVEACRTAGFLHDIGMIAVPDRVLEKESSLSEDERTSVENHCRIGKKILEPLVHLGPVSDWVLMHHERVDGSGYPQGLKGPEIPLGAQVVALADSFQALVETRPFRPAHSVNDAVEILLGTAGIWHAQEVLKAFLRVVQRKP